MPKKQIRVMDTSFCDGFQSVYGGRVLTRDFLPAVEAAKRAGIRYFEFNGGVRFQSHFFHCNENAFDMMDAFRSAVGPDIELQTLSGGATTVCMEPQGSDIIRLHAQLFRKHGVSTVRIFDPLNDPDNISFNGRCVIESGMNHQVAISMMQLPPGCSGADTTEFYTGILKKILDAGVVFDSICFKDSTGTTLPDKVFEIIKRAREILPANTFISFHTHDTAGIAVMAYRAALAAGADGIDLAMSPVSGGPSQPDVLTMWHVLRDTEYDLGIDVDRVVKAEKIFADCMRNYFVSPEARAANPFIIFSLMPGGYLTANTQKMKDAGDFNCCPEVFKAIGEVIIRGGSATSIAPVSQYYFEQAYNNVTLGSWQLINEGYGKLVLGYFGKPPVAPDPEIVKLAEAQLNLVPVSESPRILKDRDADSGVVAARRKLAEAGVKITDENIFIAATCHERGLKFLRGRAEVSVNRAELPPSACLHSSAKQCSVNRISGDAFGTPSFGDGVKVIPDVNTCKFDLS